VAQEAVRLVDGWWGLEPWASDQHAFLSKGWLAIGVRGGGVRWCSA
jgi:hypothetical protein